MKDYNEFPPIVYFLRTLKNCPRSAFLYCQLWKKKAKYNRVLIQKKDVRKEFLVSPTMFRNLLSPLMFLNLVTFTENDEKFQIDIQGQKSNDQ